MNNTDELKISEMEEAQQVNNEDLIMIVQDGINKKTKAENVGIGGEATGDTLPLGAVIEWYSDIIPENWLLCNGQAISRADYPELFNVLGTKYGTGDGNTTFNLPNLKGKVAVGKDAEDIDFNELGKTGGEKEHTLTEEELPKLTGEIGVAYHKYFYEDAQGIVKRRGTLTTVSEITTGQSGPKDNASTGFKVEFGANQPHNITQPHIVCNFIIKAKQSSGRVATVVDNLNSASKTDALSAKQGKELQEKIAKLEDVILYDNQQGTIEDITLTESVEKFRDIEIFYFDSHSLHNSTKVFEPNKKKINLSTFHVYSQSGTVFAYTRTVTATDNEINNGTQDDIGAWGSWNNNIEKTNVIKIYKVIGHK